MGRCPAGGPERGTGDAVGPPGPRRVERRFCGATTPWPALGRGKSARQQGTLGRHRLRFCRAARELYALERLYGDARPMDRNEVYFLQIEERSSRSESCRSGCFSDDMGKVYCWAGGAKAGAGPMQNMEQPTSHSSWPFSSVTETSTRQMLLPRRRTAARAIKCPWLAPRKKWISASRVT